MSVILDCADQQAYAAPHFALKSKSTEAARKLAVHLMGGIDHGRQVYGMTFLNNIKHGNNLTIEALHRILVNRLAIDGKLPENLYLQLDNTAKQCKGKYVLGYLALLVAYGVFKTVTLSFLPVGHTHEDIGPFKMQNAERIRTCTIHTNMHYASH